MCKNLHSICTADLTSRGDFGMSVTKSSLCSRQPGDDLDDHQSDSTACLCRCQPPQVLISRIRDAELGRAGPGEATDSGEVRDRGRVTVGTTGDGFGGCRVFVFFFFVWFCIDLSHGSRL